MLKNTKPVSINVKNVEEVLKVAFKDQPLDYTIDQKAIVLRYNNSTEQATVAKKTITGKVLDENNEPIPGAAVRVKGIPTAPIAITDGKGNFMISAKDSIQQTILL